jgi:Probable Zinc-ribbon domain
VNEAERLFTRQVRPYARETVDSFSARILKANFETDVQKRHLIRQVVPVRSVEGDRAAWLAILAKRTGRSTDYLLPHPSGWLTHEAGDGCDRCADTLPERWMCTLCTKGEVIAQNPHFDNIVCVRHSQWVGLTTKPKKQYRVGAETVEAEILFRKLKRKHRIDVQLFNALLTATARKDDTRTEEEKFVLVIQLAEVITEFQFARRFFRPDHTYAESHWVLSEAIRPLVGDRTKAVARGIWITAMPSFWTIRNAIITGQPPEQSWAHDMPFPASIINWKINPTDLQPFEKFFAVTEDDMVSVADYLGRGMRNGVVRDASPGLLPRHTELNICSAGHQFAAAPSTSTGYERGRPAQCPDCRAHTVQIGYNDLATTHPQLVEEWDEDLNAGYSPSDVTASSLGKWFWICSSGHSFVSDLSNRTSGHGKCPYCQHRKVGIGINDLTTTHPHLVAEWDPARIVSFTPTSVSAGSKRIAAWVCPDGHPYSARVIDRANGFNCPDCEYIRRRNTEKNLALEHPGIAAEWHPSLNGALTPDQRTPGSHDFIIWQCPNDVTHYYRQRIDRRVDGYSCSICSKRRVVAGVNDLATSDPLLVQEWLAFMNWKRPSEIAAGTEVYWWECKNNHRYKQSVPNRRKSNGCPKCAPGQRILAPTEPQG